MPKLYYKFALSQSNAVISGAQINYCNLILMIIFMKTFSISKIRNTNVEVITKGVTFKLRGIMCIYKKPVIRWSSCTSLFDTQFYEKRHLMERNFIKVIY